MAITLVDTFYLRNGINYSSISMPNPSLNVGDVVVLTVMADQDNGSAITQLSGPTFTKVHESASTAGRDRRSAFFYRVWDGTESASTVWENTGDTNRAKSVCMSAWRGVDTSTPFDVTWNTTNHFSTGGNNWNSSGKSVTTVTDNAVVIVAQTITHDDITAAGAPSGYTIAIDGTGTTRDNSQQIHVYKTVATAGLENPGAFTHTVNNTVSEAEFRTIALRPAPAATGQTLKVWDGSAWSDGVIKHWDGSSWVELSAGKVKHWDGSSWAAV